jgi:putative hydrolase of the HAD superfamily
MNPRFDLIVFDLGGVLVKAIDSLTEVHRLAGFPFAPPDAPAFEARLAEMPRRDNGAVNSKRYFELFSDASDGVYTVSDAELMSDAALIAEYPGIDSVFDMLDTAGVQSAALSNTNDAHWGHMFPSDNSEPEFPNLARLGHRFASHLLGVLKPDARAYRAVERQSGFSSEQILFFDDKQENVEAACRLGWTAERIDPTNDTASQILAILNRFGVS